jgi:hypothetical protein
MKVGIIGAGAVDAATGLALIERQVCRDIVLIDCDRAKAAGTALDLRYAAPLTPAVEVDAGGYDLLTGADLAIITAGVNERPGGAIDRCDPQGRPRLAADNARIYADIVPRVVQAAPQAVLMVVTDPPDPLTDITRGLAGHSRVFSTGTLLDSLRFPPQTASAPPPPRLHAGRSGPCPRRSRRGGARHHRCRRIRVRRRGRYTCHPERPGTPEPMATGSDAGATRRWSPLSWQATSQPAASQLPSRHQTRDGATIAHNVWSQNGPQASARGRSVSLIVGAAAK